MTIYKAFLRPLIDYGDTIYDQPQNESFCEKLESVKHKAALAITSAMQGISPDKIYQELALESLKSRSLSCIFKIMKEEAPNYLINFVPKCETNTRTRNNNISTFNCRKNCFKYSFFSSTLKDWFNLDFNIRNVKSISIFKSRLLSFILPVQTNMYTIFLTKRFDISNSPEINEHRFRKIFQDYVNPLCFCSSEIEDTSHYLLHCHHFSHHRVVLFFF